MAGPDSTLSPEHARVENPIYRNLSALRATILFKQETMPNKQGIFMTHTSDDPTQGYTAISDTQHDEPFISVFENTPPKPNTAAKKDHRVAIALDKSGIIEVTIDPTQVPEAATFEDVPVNDANYYKRMWGDKIRIRCPVDQLGPNTGKFLQQYTEALRDVWEEQRLAA